MTTGWDEVSGTFYRIVSEADRQRVLDGARSREGRFHHSGLPALYLSSRVDWAAKAIEPYRRAGDGPRLAVPLQVEGARIVDLRKATIARRCRSGPTTRRFPGGRNARRACDPTAGGRRTGSEAATPTA